MKKSGLPGSHLSGNQQTAVRFRNARVADQHARHRKKRCCAGCKRTVNFAMGILTELAAKTPLNSAVKKILVFRTLRMPSHVFRAKPDDCRSVANNASVVSHNSVQARFIISPNLDQNRPMKSGPRADDLGSLHVTIATSFQNASIAGAALPGLAAMIAPLNAPIETPATMSG